MVAGRGGRDRPAAAQPDREVHQVGRVEGGDGAAHRRLPVLGVGPGGHDGAHDQGRRPRRATARSDAGRARRSVVVGRGSRPASSRAERNHLGGVDVDRPGRARTGCARLSLPDRLVGLVEQHRGRAQHPGRPGAGRGEDAVGAGQASQRPGGIGVEQQPSASSRWRAGSSRAAAHSPGPRRRRVRSRPSRRRGRTLPAPGGRDPARDPDVGGRAFEGVDRGSPDVDPLLVDGGTGRPAAAVIAGPLRLARHRAARAASPAYCRPVTSLGLTAAAAVSATAAARGRRHGSAWSRRAQRAGISPSGRSPASAWCQARQPGSVAARARRRCIARCRAGGSWW